MDSVELGICMAGGLVCAGALATMHAVTGTLSIGGAVALFVALPLLAPVAVLIGTWLGERL